MPKAKTQEQFVQEVQEKFNGEYTVLGQYINNRTNILIRHNKCGHEFMKNPKDMISKGSGCPYCNGNRNKLYNEDWVKKNTPAPYHYVSGYTKMSEKCLFHCDECNSDFKQSPSRLINEHIYGCNCCPTKKKTNEQFLKEIKDVSNEYQVLDEYINMDTPITFIHLKCGTKFKLSPYNFIYKHNKTYCPLCYYKKSKGEVKINIFLEQNNIQYYKEYSFKQLPLKKFDFFLPEYNMCIEFDGKQHYEAVDFFGGEEGFKDTVQRDLEKNQFCIQNNITLLRIPYTEINNIDFIMTKIFKEKSSETIEKYKIY